MALEETIGIWATAIFTIFAWSFLIRDNRFFRFAEHVMIGVAVGYAIAITTKTFLTVGWTPLIQKPQLASLLTLIISLLMFSRFFPKGRWLNRWPIALLLGVGTALALRGIIQAQILEQIIATAVPLVTPTPFNTFNNILVIVMVVTTVAYFFFTKEHKGLLGAIAKVGRCSMMVMFGAIFGGTVTTRVVAMIGVLQFLLMDWLGLVK